MQNKKILSLIIFAAIIVAAVILFFWKAQTASSGNIILFYGDTCPHCKNVEAFLTANKAAEKIKFEQREVYSNQANARLMAEKYALCKLPAEGGMGVPFLWDGERCYSGENEVMDFFRARLP